MTAGGDRHLVFSTRHTIDASKTVERIVGAFDAGDQRAVRVRLAGSFRYDLAEDDPEKGRRTHSDHRAA